MSIELAKEKDIDDIIRLGQRMHGDSAYRWKGYEDKHIRPYLQALISDPESIGYVAGMPIVARTDDGEMIGFILAYAARDYFGPDAFIGEAAFYVIPEVRNTGTGKNLIEAFLSLREILGIEDVRLGITSSKEIAEQINTYLERTGFNKVGAVYFTREK